MSTIAISEQLQTIKRATAKITKSKKTALSFLIQAGLVNSDSAKKPKPIKAVPAIKKTMI